jgi:predicted DsbA family dithiol-disulfide isomerase
VSPGLIIASISVVGLNAWLEAWAWQLIALRRFRESDQKDVVKFTVRFEPFQLYPEATKEGEDKYDWYRKSRYGDSEDKMKMYITLMTAYGVSAGINYKFGGTVANTMDAHRVVQHFQEEKGPEAADKILNCEASTCRWAEHWPSKALYSQYFENERHPSSDETLLKATTDAGIPAEEAEPFIKDKDDGMLDVKNAVREQAGNGVDSVPSITFEGKRRDITLVGAKEVEEYEKALTQIAKESQ